MKVPGRPSMIHAMQRGCQARPGYDPRTILFRTESTCTVPPANPNGPAPLAPSAAGESPRGHAPIIRACHGAFLIGLSCGRDHAGPGASPSGREAPECVRKHAGRIWISHTGALVHRAAGGRADVHAPSTASIFPGEEPEMSLQNAAAQMGTLPAPPAALRYRLLRRRAPAAR